MFGAYFRELEKELLETYKTAGKGVIAKKGKEKGVSEYPVLAQAIDGMISADISVSIGSIVDPSGYSPNPAELTLYRKPVKNMDEIFGHRIPSELVYSTIHVAPMLDRKNLLERLVDVAHVKKCDRYSESNESSAFIASFIVSFDSSYTLEELKKNVLEVYKEQDVGSDFEVDIIAILGKGIMVKNWREQRSYVALETEMETLKWLFILMREYLEINKGDSFDLRSYVKDQTHYKEY
jgi:hypothetical protein